MRRLASRLRSVGLAFVLAVAAPAAGCGAGVAAPAPAAAPGDAHSPGPRHAHGHAHSDAHAHGHGDARGHGDAHGHGHGGPLVHRFERADDWAKEFDDPARDAWQRPADVIAAMRIAPGMTVVDLGAGTGYFLPHLARAVGPSGRVLGLDIEADMVRYMRERAAREGLANVTAKRVRGDDPELAPGSVDRVLIVDTWHHIPSRAAYAAKLAAALRPGGAVLVVDFTEASTHGPPKRHRISPDAVADELRAGGLIAEIAPEPLPDQYIVIGRRDEAP